MTKRKTSAELAAHHISEAKRHEEKALLAEKPHLAELVRIVKAYRNWSYEHPADAINGEAATELVEDLDKLARSEWSRARSEAKE